MTGNSLVFTQRSEGLRKLIESLMQHGKELLACRSARKRARLAPEQALATIFLEKVDPVTDGRWRYTRLLSCRFETQAPCGCPKGMKSDQWRQAEHEYILDEIDSSVVKFFEFAFD
jgi:hypothetical protein